MAVTTASIKKLREETEAPVMEVKRALEEAKGNVVKAKDILREKAVMRAEKKKEREAGAGMIFSYIHQGGAVGVLLDLHCETDFVAKTTNFQNLGKELMLQIASMDPQSVTELLERGRVLHQYPLARTFAHTHNNRRRGRKPERAGTSNNEYAHK